MSGPNSEPSTLKTFDMKSNLTKVIDDLLKEHFLKLNVFIYCIPDLFNKTQRAMLSVGCTLCKI